MTAFDFQAVEYEWEEEPERNAVRITPVAVFAASAPLTLVASVALDGHELLPAFAIRAEAGGNRRRIKAVRVIDPFVRRSGEEDSELRFYRLEVTLRTGDGVTAMQACRVELRRPGHG